MKGMGNIMKQAKKLQEQMEKIQEDLEQKQVEGTSGGGMVVAVANGKQEIISVRIDPEVVVPNDVEMLEDLILSAVNQALEKASAMAQEEMQKVTGGIIPGVGGMKLPWM